MTPGPSPEPPPFRSGSAGLSVLVAPSSGGLQLRAAAFPPGLVPPSKTPSRADVVLVISLPAAERRETKGSRGGGGDALIIFAVNCSPRSSEPAAKRRRNVGWRIPPLPLQFCGEHTPRKEWD